MGTNPLNSTIVELDGITLFNQYFYQTNRINSQSACIKPVIKFLNNVYQNMKE